jgi:poly(A) polymerase
LLSGNDLIAAGHTPGPEFARMLEAVEDAQLENRIRTKQEALELVRNVQP